MLWIVLVFVFSIVNISSLRFNRCKPLRVRSKLSMEISDVPTSMNRKFGKSLNHGLRNTLLATAAIGAVFSAQNKPVQARFFASAEQNAIDEISSYQKPIAELLDQLKPVEMANAVGVYQKTQLLRGGLEDSQVVLTYSYNYIQPLQRKMELIAPSLGLVADAQDRVKVLPLLMKGHIAELRQAITSMKAEDQAREVEEVQETLAEFLKLASAKYELQRYTARRPLTEAEYMGPLGCEFWGKKRVEGSNACIEIQP